MRRGRVTLALCVLVMLGTATACASGDEPNDSLQAVENPVAAKPAAAPAQAEPDGTVHPLAEDVSAMVADPSTRTIVVVFADTPELRLYAMDEPEARPRTVKLPGPPDSLNRSDADGVVLASIGARNQVVRVSLPTGSTTPIDVAGAPVSAAERGDRMLVGLRESKGVRMVDNGRPGKTTSGELYGADQVLTVADRAYVLDRKRTAVFEVKQDEGDIGSGQRVGFGAGAAVVDSYERLLVTDTRGDALLALSTDPLLVRQQFPVPGAPYGIAYDEKRDLAWVTLTARNEVVGFDVAGGEPEERYRFSSVRQPNSVTVDSHTGRVFVASATGDGLQVMRP
ncbi:hypothetical protein EV191_107252 [Tamaricihabitans halophyticus]|uniref:DNA-binding beta-propeller fold protein YncE n=1 Tax=Tamaricihabitans halophyticus TaxID=1262583 RepID=A0A4R2QQP1_9PSEU|nr:hypothetical protein [Tamaricihabitans halophyticus]TCP50988.1 hypothetical protein EV191_107252 [Tamaricihabitans halophyticus]